MERPDAREEALTEAVERVAAQRRARHRALLRPEPTTASLAERVVALPNGVNQALALGVAAGGDGARRDPRRGVAGLVATAGRAVAAEVVLDPPASVVASGAPTAPGTWTDPRDWRA